jgi:hypothetical protein
MHKLAEYQTQFRKWKFAMNVKKSDWVYISRKLNLRRRKDSTVYHERVLIPLEKVKKNISRHVHPNEMDPWLTPLQKAAERGDIQAAKLLIQYGANINAPPLGQFGTTEL